MLADAAEASSSFVMSYSLVGMMVANTVVLPSELTCAWYTVLLGLVAGVGCRGLH
jgi:hypothetical protein